MNSDRRRFASHAMTYLTPRRGERSGVQDDNPNMAAGIRTWQLGNLFGGEAPLFGVCFYRTGAHFRSSWFHMVSLSKSGSQIVWGHPLQVPDCILISLSTPICFHLRAGVHTNSSHERRPSFFASANGNSLLGSSLSRSFIFSTRPTS